MRSYLVVGNQTLASPELETAIREVLTAGETDFHVVVPVEPAQKGFTWDEGEARAAARDRLDAFIHKLESMGAEASGEIGSRDPIEAVHDALRSHPADEIILSTLPPGPSVWIRQDLPHRVTKAFSLPVTHVVAKREPTPA